MCIVCGDRTPILLAAESGSVVAQAVEALGGFPRDPAWVLVGGLAVFLRLGSVHRPTADADTVARSQEELLAELAGSELTTVISRGNVEVSLAVGEVDIDVMDLADDPLPDDGDRRAFALAKRLALATRVQERVIVADIDGSIIVEASLPVATVAAIVAMKTVSMIRRPHGAHPEKVGSDIHDLVRLVGVGGARRVAQQLVEGDRELAAWVGQQAARAFGKDLRYSVLRMRRFDRSAGAQALSDEELAAIVVLSEAIAEAEAEE
jgi:hypothetical protein